MKRFFLWLDDYSFKNPGKLVVFCIVSIVLSAILTAINLARLL